MIDRTVSIDRPDCRAMSAFVAQQHKPSLSPSQWIANTTRW
jgi:hypothetical protein